MLVHVLLFQIHVYVLICSSLFLVLLSPSFVLHFSCFDCFYSTYHLILFILLCLNPFLFLGEVTVIKKAKLFAADGKLSLVAGIPIVFPDVTVRIRSEDEVKKSSSTSGNHF
jgi:hypothetical protein